MTSKLISFDSQAFYKCFQYYLLDNLRLTSDVSCFQGTQISDPAVFHGFADAWRGPCFWSPTIGKQAGVLVSINESFQGEVREDYWSLNLMVLTLTC